jgi:hypothetical protein
MASISLGNAAPTDASKSIACNGPKQYTLRQRSLELKSINASPWGA